MQKKVRFIFNPFKLLKIGQIGGTYIPFFTKSNNFTKSHLMSFFNNISELKAYIPDDVKEGSITRDYLLNVLFYIRSDIYNELYKQYKSIKVSRIYNKWNNFYVDLPVGVMDEVKKYNPIEK